MPPLWQYFSRAAERQTSPSLAPKGLDHGPRGLFPANRHFPGDHGGATIAFCRPRLADAVVVGEGHAPVVAVLLLSEAPGGVIKFTTELGRRFACAPGFSRFCCRLPGGPRG